MSNETTITPPRVPLIDPRTGLISREWYRFFLNLFTLTGSGQTDITVLTVHETENLNIATQTFAHQPPQQQMFNDDQNILTNQSFSSANYQQEAYDKAQDILAKQTFLNTQQAMQMAFDQIIFGVQSFAHKTEPVINYSSDQYVLSNRVFGG